MDEILVEGTGEPVWVPVNSEKQKTNNEYGFGNRDPGYSDLVDQVEKNNTWSAEQAQKQMDFQRELFNKANEFNTIEAQVNRDFQQDSSNRAMEFSSAEAEKNRNWQKMMSDTAHQREMRDLQAAGLNPILAANNGASIGAGSAASSAQAAGYGASSTGAPSGAKGDTDESGTMAIASLLGKMLDNQTEIQKMIVSAETARETADMYTGATRYAAELSSYASELASLRSSEASKYGSELSYEASRYAAELGFHASDLASWRSSEAARYGHELNYQAQMSNPYYILGDQIRSVLDVLSNRGISAAAGVSGLFGSNNLLQSASDKLQDIARRVIDKITPSGSVIKHGKNSWHLTGKF